MHASKLVVGSFLLAFGLTGCSDDTPGPGTPTPDSGNPMPDGGNPGDGAADDGGETIPPGDMRPCEASTIANGNFKLTHAGVEYGYVVHVPPSYDGTKRTPLLVNWHGAGVGGTEQELYSKGNVTSDAEGYLAVYPSAPDKTWAGGTCCAQFLDGGNPDRDDVGFARALVTEISKIGCVDSKKIYTTGMSTGAFLAHRLACEAADLFAAVVPVAGKMGVTPCTPARPVPVMHFHGTVDMTIPYDSPMFSAEDVNVPDMMARWGTRNGCTKGPDVTFQNGNVTCKTWSQCTAGADVVLCTVDGGGHCWPDGFFCQNNNPLTRDISATVDGWKFLRRFALP